MTALPTYTSATFGLDSIMPSAREWFEAQLAKDVSIAPCQIKNHNCSATRVQVSRYVFNCSRCVRMSGLGENIVAKAKNRVRKGLVAVEAMA